MNDDTKPETLSDGELAREAVKRIDSLNVLMAEDPDKDFGKAHLDFLDLCSGIILVAIRKSKENTK